MTTISLPGDEEDREGGAIGRAVGRVMTRARGGTGSRPAVREALAPSRVSIERGRATSTGDVRHDPARSRRQHDDPVGDQDRLGDAVRDQDHRRAGEFAEAEQLEIEAFARQRIERAERLVEQEHLRLERERPGERDALARAARELGGAGDQGRRLEADQLGQLEQPPIAPFGRPTGELERVGDVVAAGPPRQQPRLLEDQPDRADSGS